MYCVSYLVRIIWEHNMNCSQNTWIIYLFIIFFSNRGHAQQNSKNPGTILSGVLSDYQGYTQWFRGGHVMPGIELISWNMLGMCSCHLSYLPNHYSFLYFKSILLLNICCLTGTLVEPLVKWGKRYWCSKRKRQST